jgi:hypothetical protein
MKQFVSTLAISWRSMFWAVFTLGLISGRATSQEISAPLVRRAASPQISITLDTVELMSASPAEVWVEGSPIKVRDDFVQSDSALGATPITAAPVRPTSADPLLKRNRAGQLTANVAPIVGPGPQGSISGIGQTAAGLLPPDSIGAVGPNYYIQMVNSAFAIYSKGGTLLAGPSKISSLWTGITGPCATDNEGDPVVRYDQLADRWLVSQFGLQEHIQCIAISRSSDPVNGGWYLYQFDTLDANGNPVTPDYPKIGVWPDGYYMSTQRGFPNSGLDVWVFERAKMLIGDKARQVQFAIPKPSVVLLPSDLDGPPPSAGTPDFFVRPVDGKRFGGSNRIELYAFAVNWADPTKSTFQKLPPLSPKDFNTVLCSSDLMSACVPQQGSSVKLESLTAWPMFRAQYRHFADHDTLLLNHTVNADGKGTAGIRWYVLNKDGSGNWTIAQQGTHSPDSLYRWMGSMAMDSLGNIVLAYTTSGGKMFPSLRAAVHMASDPIGTFQPEFRLKDGGGAQTFSAVPRWGDYSSVDVDPQSPCQFWFSSEYYDHTSDGTWSTAISQITLPNCAAATASTQDH